MTTHIKNFTFSLPTEIIDNLKEYAKDHYIASVNAGVKEAILEYTFKLEKEKFKKEMKEASKDLVFLNDLELCMKDFESSDAEVIRGTTEW